MSVWDLPDFPSEIFDTEEIVLRPRLASLKGSSGAPGVAMGAPVVMPCQIDPISAEVALMAGIEDIRAVYEVHLSGDPGPGFDEGATASSDRTGPGPAVVIRKLVWAPNHVVLAVQGRR